MFNANELEKGKIWLMDSNVCVCGGGGGGDVLATMCTTPSLFKTLTNFTLGEFEELATLMIPTIVSHA
jgi:hypothetical protein